MTCGLLARQPLVRFCERGRLDPAVPRFFKFTERVFSILHSCMDRQEAGKILLVDRFAASAIVNQNRVSA